MKPTNLDVRDFAAEPLTPGECMFLFRDEDSYLALATEGVILAAADIADAFGDYQVANDIHSRWLEYQEELRCMMAEFM